jgi:hypothetical protein
MTRDLVCGVPPWAELSEPDEQAVVHSRRVDGLIDLDGGELTVDVVQRDDLRLIDGGIALVREPAWVRVAGVRINLDHAVSLARILLSAKEIAEPPQEIEPRQGSGCDVVGTRLESIERLRMRGAFSTPPEQAAPARTAPARTAPARTAPARTAPARTAPARTAPARAATARTGCAR